MGLWKNDRVDIFMPESSDWKSRCSLETYLEPNELQNNIWLIRWTGVAGCEDLGRFMNIVLTAYEMPDLEAETAVGISNGAWDLTDEEEDEDEDEDEEDEEDEDQDDQDDQDQDEEDEEDEDEENQEDQDQDQDQEVEEGEDQEDEEEGRESHKANVDGWSSEP